MSTDISTFEVMIGLEVHVQLRTRSKMFCACSTAYGASPNTHVCPVCLGYPGTLPAINDEAIRLTVATGLMVGAEISRRSVFDRKSYFYPDMPKNYQISQYDCPLCRGGAVDIVSNGHVRSIRLRRIHLEEDVGKNMHFAHGSGVDFNRAGVPLMEIVTEPDLQSPEEAHAFLVALREILLYAEVSDCNLEEGNLRCDANCSVRPKRCATRGTKTEIKNLNTFKGLLHALRYEVSRQIAILREGGTICQETRRWDAETEMTTVMRSKEEEHDYRYFPEPDLMPVEILQERLTAWRAALPERPADRRQRLMRTYGLPEYDAAVLTADREVADFFEAAARRSARPKAISNWMMTEVLRRLHDGGKTICHAALRPEALAALVDLVERGTVNMPTAKEIFDLLWKEGGNPDDIVRARGWVQVTEETTVRQWVQEALSQHPEAVADFRKGKTAVAKFLIGHVMRLSQGKADPKLTARLIENALQEQINSE